MIGVHQPKQDSNREVSHARIVKTLESKNEGDFRLVYRNKDFVEKTGYEDFYSLQLFLYHQKGYEADLNGTAKVCEKTSFGYKSFKSENNILERMVWENDTAALNNLFSGLETIDGKPISKNDFPNAKYFFINYYASYVVGPQRRKLRMLRNSLDFENDSIMTIFINSDMILTDSATYAHQYKGFSNPEKSE